MIMEYNLEKNHEKRQFYLAESLNNFIHFEASLLPLQFHFYMYIANQKNNGKNPFNLSFPYTRMCGKM